MKLPTTHPSFPGVFWNIFWASESTKINHMHSNHRHKIGFQYMYVVYSKLNKWRAKDLNLMCKTDKKARNYIISLPRDKMSDRRQENWLCKNELTIDFRGQNKTKYNRISFLVLFGLTFEKNKSEQLIKKAIWNKKSHNFFAARRNSITAKKRWKMQIKKKKKTSQLFRHQSYFSRVKLVPIFFFSFVCIS